MKEQVLNKDSKIYVAGHTGMVGSALVRNLKLEGYKNLVLRTSDEMDLTNQAQVISFFNAEKPEYVYLAAAKVGGIMANDTYRGQFLYENLMIQNNIIDAAYRSSVKKLLFLGSSCIYPKHAAQPLKEEYLLSGKLEPTNEPYALAKIAGLKLCENYNRQYGCNFISVMPTNLYGPGDNYDPLTSHVLPAMLQKFHRAKIEQKSQVTLWGSGNPKREFLHVDDLAQACMYLMKNYSDYKPINIGTGIDISIAELAQKIKDITDYKGKIIWDTSKPDGTPRKLLDVSRVEELGWKYKTTLDKGLQKTYREKFVV